MVTAPTPEQAAANAFVTGCARRGITASMAAVPPEGQLATVRGLWADVAQAAVDAATEGALRACGYTLADVGRFLETEAAAPAGPQPAPGNAEVAYEQWIEHRDPADVGSMVGFVAGWQAAVAAASGWPLCPNGCGCRLGSEDADVCDCACDGLCCYDEIEVSEVFAERDRLRKLLADREPQPAPDPRPASMLDLVDSDDEPEPLSDVVAVPFPAGVIAAARRLAAAEGMTASAWIRREIERREQPAPELATADRLVRDILESLCRRDGLSLESTVEPGEPARNYALAERLGIGHVFGLPDAAPTGPSRPRVVCLCGSTRFYDEFQRVNYDLTMQGVIVLSVGFYPHAKAEHGHGEGVGHDSAEKSALDELHKRKIDLADEVLVVSDASGYFGASTESEIRYAVMHGKTVRFAEPAAETRAKQAGL